MKRFFLLIIALWEQRFKLYFFAALIGALTGVLIFYPVYDFIFFYESEGTSEDIQVQITTALVYVYNQLKTSLMGGTPAKTVFLGQVGAVFGLIIAFIYELLHWRLQRIGRLSSELSVNLHTLIMQGEGPSVEFKSSLRWDLEQNRVNRALETVVLKTLAGYLNSSIGGTLLIGVSDSGQIIGLEKDYKSLKRQDQDGFEQAIITAISTQLGADLCQYVKVLFHVVNGKHVCRLIVLASPRPVFLNQGNTPKFYLRTGGGTRDLNIQEAVEFIAHRWKR
ncbi:AAA family ATPase [Methyloprofundus sedimenti]|uniref:AAA family ATPase n=1 Tax=Methyloprofundus sedimenti TaxID=1420851 RepID=A0A1V8M3D0_9GAMM|nr:ATP-binding protein [Methyloprofundus sedimenti]OQK16067.1 AAA family ATPase [Methyloprofundus sedimenti]